MNKIYVLMMMSVSVIMYPMMHFYDSKNAKVEHSINFNIMHFYPAIIGKDLKTCGTYGSYIFNSGRNVIFKEPLFIEPNREGCPSQKKPVVFLREFNEDLSLSADLFGDANTNQMKQQANEQLFVLKCYDYAENLWAVCETIGSSIGASVEMPINKVKIIPEAVTFVEKSNWSGKSCIATLHTCVPGLEIEKWDYPYNYLDFNPWRNLKCLYGFNNGRYHADLCDIAALDIFINNEDRHSGNFTFHKKANRFYGFDHDRCYLPAILVSFEALTFLKKNREKLYTRQKRALKRMNWRLKMLSSCFSNQDIWNFFVQIAREANYVYSNEEIKKFKNMIIANRKYVREIIGFIDKL